jgi:hypothetical protein
VTPVRRGGSPLAVRITALCVGVAGVVAVVAGLVSARLADTVADHVSRTTLAAQADVVAGQLAATGGPGSRIGLGKVAGVLAGQGIAVVLLPPAGRPTGKDRQAVAVVREAGITGPPAGLVSDTVTVGGRSVLVEARGTPNGGFALVQRVGLGAAVTPLLRRDTLLSLGIGLVVAAVAGLLLAGLLSRPLRRTAEALRTGTQS